MSTTITEGKPDDTLPKPGKRTQARIDEATKRNMPRPVRAAVKLAADKITSIGPPHSDLSGWSATMIDAFGTTSNNFMASELARVMDTIREPGEKVAGEIETNAALAVIDGTQPRDEIEAMLASQMIASGDHLSTGMVAPNAPIPDSGRCLSPAGGMPGEYSECSRLTNSTDRWVLSFKLDPDSSAKYVGQTRDFLITDVTEVRGART